MCSHCRLCGDLFCSNCCNSYLSVNPLGEHKVGVMERTHVQRFCNECYSLLNKVKQLNSATKWLCLFYLLVAVSPVLSHVFESEDNQSNEEEKPLVFLLGKKCNF